MGTLEVYDVVVSIKKGEEWCTGLIFCGRTKGSKFRFFGNQGPTF